MAGVELSMASIELLLHYVRWQRTVHQCTVQEADVSQSCKALVLIRPFTRSPAPTYILYCSECRRMSWAAREC